MFKNIQTEIFIKIISNGSCQKQNYQGILQQSNNLTRISYDEIYEGEGVQTAFSLLTDNSLRIVKKGAYSYTLELKKGEKTPFLLNYGAFSVDYLCDTKEVKFKILDNKIEVYAHYLLISGGEKSSTKIYLTAKF